MSVQHYSLSKRQFGNLIKIIIHQFECDYNYFDDDDGDGDNWMHFGWSECACVLSKSFRTGRQSTEYIMQKNISKSIMRNILLFAV